MAVTSQALILSLKPLRPPSLSPPSPRHPLTFLSPLRTTTLPPPPSRRRIIGCIVSGFGGGGVSDTRKSEFSREFAVIATMLKRIQPLDSSDISKGVSDSAKDSMLQTISKMLGVLPSDQFDVDIRISTLPLHRILFSSIITGYTLWNAEYRMSLMRNFELPLDRAETPNAVEGNEGLGLSCKEREGQNEAVCVHDSLECWPQIGPDALKGLSSEALDYIQQLEAELSSTKKELDAQKQDASQLASDKGNSNSLLQYLRSLKSDMVLELSQPSSIEVKEVIHELVLNTMQSFFEDDVTSEAHEKATVENMSDHVGDDGLCEMITTPRDYLAKLLFWCMLLGHHLRGLENRLHLSCVVGLL